jgi:hypothetical protein
MTVHEREDDDVELIEGFTIPGTRITLNTMELVGVAIAIFCIFALIYMLMFPAEEDKFEMPPLMQLYPPQVPQPVMGPQQYQPMMRPQQYQPVMGPQQYQPVMGYDRPWSGPKLKTLTPAKPKDAQKLNWRQKAKLKAKGKNPTTIKVENGKQGNVVLEL